jgi:undecaprenol kinase/diacylglycerol kinase (ATP)
MKILQSFGYAIKGILIVLEEQLNFTIHLSVLLLVLVAGFYFKIEKWEWLAVILCSALVLVTEMLNSAIEYLVDFISPEFHVQAGKIKDVAAGAVLLASFFSAVVGVLIFGKYILEIL